MTQQEKSTAGTRQRLGLPTPEFFVKIRMWCLIIGGVFTGSVTVWNTIAPSNVLNLLIAIGGTFTLISTVLASLPVDWEKVEVEQGQ